MKKPKPTQLSERDQKLLAEILEASLALKKKAEAISTAPPKGK